jgi:hypothetical protein
MNRSVGLNELYQLRKYDKTSNSQRTLESSKLW